MVRKEFIQMRRDRMTFGMMIGVPMIQLILFGYAINSDPKHLPTAVYSADNSVFARTHRAGACTTAAISTSCASRRTRRRSTPCSQQNIVQFAVTIPVDFSRKLLRGEKAGPAARSRCHRSDGRRIRDRGDECTDADGLEPRS